MNRHKSKIINKLLIILTFFTSTLSSCHQKTDNAEIPLIEIGDLWDAQGHVNLSEIAASIEYVALEKTDACILPAEGKLSAKMFADLILIDADQMGIMVFDQQGKFKFPLGRIGDGPGEYTSPIILPDPPNELIWIVDQDLDKLIQYDFQGKFITEISMVEYYQKITIHRSILYMVRFDPVNPEKSTIQTRNPQGEVVDVFPLYGEYAPGVGYLTSGYAFLGFINNELHFNEAPFTFGYKLNSKKKWIPTWKLDQGKKAVDPEDYFPDSPIHGETWAMTSISRVREFPKFLMMYGNSERTGRQFFYFKESNQVKANHIIAETENTRDMRGLFNDIDGGLPFYPRTSFGENKYIQINDALRYIDVKNGLLKYYPDIEKVPVSEELMNFSNTLKEEDNPVVMIVTLK